MARNDIKWLLGELPDLVEKNVISPETREALLSHYQLQEPDKKRNSNLSFIITATLGSVLIAAGIIAIIAHNWDDFGRPLRTVFTLLPLLIAQCLYGYAFFKKSDSAGWMEGTSVFLSLMVLSSLALISQTYNLGGNLCDLLLIWSIVIFPLIYLKRVFFTFLVLLTAITWRGVEAIDYISPVYNLLIYAGFMIAILPYIRQVFSAGTHKIIREMLGWCLLLSTATVLLSIFAEAGFKLPLLCAALCSFYYLLGLILKIRAFQTSAVVGTYILILFYSFNMYEDYNDRIRSIETLFYISLGIVFILTIIPGFINLRRKEEINPFPALAVFSIGLFYLLVKNGAGIEARVFSNAFLLGYGIYFIRKGLRDSKIALINLGLLFIAVLALVRFFDSDFDFVIKGIAFIVVGLGFLLSNNLINRQIKKHES